MKQGTLHRKENQNNGLENGRDPGSNVTFTGKVLTGRPKNFCCQSSWNYSESSQG